MSNLSAKPARHPLPDDDIARLASLAELVRHDVTPDEFYAALLDCCARGAIDLSARIWVRSDLGKFACAAAVNVTHSDSHVTGPDSRHQKHLSDAVAKAEPVLFKLPQSTEEHCVAPTLLVGQQSAALELVSPSSVTSDDQLLLTTAAEIAVEFSREWDNRAAGPGDAPASAVRPQSQIEHLGDASDAFLRKLHEQRSLPEVTAVLANDGRAVIGCDRIAVAIRTRRRFDVMAVTGLASIDARANAIRAMTELASRVGQLQQSVAYPSSEQDSEASKLISDYLEHSAATRVVAEPLVTSDGICCGVLIAEWFGAGSGAAVPRDVVEHSAIAVRRSTLDSGLQVGALWQASFSTRVLTAVLVVVLALCFVPAELSVEATGEMQPATRRNIFATRDAVVDKVLVDNGAEVTLAQTLVELKDSTLEYELSRVNGEIETASQRRAAIDASVVLSTNSTSAREAAESAELGQLLESLIQRRAILERAQKDLILRSPIGGELMTWSPRERLHARPVRRGQALLAVADPDGDWLLDVTVTDEDYAQIAAAWKNRDEPLPVSFRTSTQPGRVWTGRLETVATTTETDELLGPVVRLTIAMTGKQRPQCRAGVGVVARIDCGRRSLGYVWLRGLIDSVSARVAMW